MTAAELARHNLVRLVRESGRDTADVAIVAWPVHPDARLTVRQWNEAVDTRRKKLRRYLGEETRDGEPVTIPLDELDNLARALDVERAEFLREVET